MNRFELHICTGVLLLTQFSLPLPAQEAASAKSEVAATSADDVENTNEESKPEYVRIRRNDRKLAAALETSVILFGNSKQYPRTTVELIGAIHLGEPQYYDKLNSMFSKYDVLLYEAVMPKEAVKRGFRPGVGGGRRSLTDEDQWTEAKIGLQAISVLQLGAKDALGLEFQLAGVDYTSRNFVHADMTQEEFEASMAKRGESFSQMLAREMGKAALQQQQVNPFAQSLDLALSLLASDRRYRVRRIAAVELTKANDGDAFAGADGTSTIITERNTKALEVLQAQLKKGRKRIGVFYGAGHFPDMEKRVLDEFGYERLSEEWVTAWELRAPARK
jgi:hypothetical protein